MQLGYSPSANIRNNRAPTSSVRRTVAKTPGQADSTRPTANQWRPLTGQQLQMDAIETKIHNLKKGLESNRQNTPTDTTGASDKMLELLRQAMQFNLVTWASPAGTATSVKVLWTPSGKSFVDNLPTAENPLDLESLQEHSADRLCLSYPQHTVPIKGGDEGCVMIIRTVAPETGNISIGWALVALGEQQLVHNFSLAP